MIGQPVRVFLREQTDFQEGEEKSHGAADALSNNLADFHGVAPGHYQLVGELKIAIIDSAMFHQTSSWGKPLSGLAS